MSATLTRQLVIRVPDRLLAALEHDAAMNGRTVAQSVRFHLRRSLLAPNPAPIEPVEKPHG